MSCEHEIKLIVAPTDEACKFHIDVSAYKDRIVAPDEYSGATVVTPSDSEQVLATKDKLVRDDITVESAPTEVLATNENGTFQPSDGNVGFSSVTVDVEAVLESLTVTENGLHLPESGVDGFDRVVVNVANTIGTFIKSVTIEAPAGRPNVSHSANGMLTLFDLSDAGIYLVLAENNDITNGVNAVFLFKMSGDATTTDNGFKFMTISKEWTTSNASRAAQVLCDDGAVLKLYQLPVPIVQ